MRPPQHPEPPTLVVLAKYQHLHGVRARPREPGEVTQELAPAQMVERTDPVVVPRLPVVGDPVTARNDASPDKTPAPAASTRRRGERLHRAPRRGPTRSRP